MNHADQREAARYRQEILSAYRAYLPLPANQRLVVLYLPEVQP